jgi:amino acid transporter, AAT family
LTSACDQQDGSPRSHGVPSAGPSSGAEDLQRRLTERQLGMIAIGGAIGVGLFLGSGVTIQLAGPAVLITYFIGAVVAAIVAFALAEMAVVHPVAGSFGIYAEQYLSAWAGYAVRATYGIVQIIAIGAEVTAVAIYFGFWFPAVPPWIWVVSASAALVAVNAMHVGRFGEFEYWFALIKVAAIIIFIVLGLALILGIGRPALGLGNLTQHGGFMPKGWSGVWLALTLAITSYMGLEVIAVTAGEAEKPEKAIPRAMRTIVLRLILFYILALFVSLCVSPWNLTVAGSGLSASPFVRTFASVGIPFAAGIMNAVVITAALSSANTDLYLSTRMLFSLARGGFAPASLGRLSSSGVPVWSLLVSTGGMAAAILLAIYAPKNAFLVLYGTAVAGMFFVWGVILISHLRFRAALGAERVAKLPLRVPAHPLPTLIGIITIAAIAVTTFWVDGLQYTVPTFVVMLGVISIAYRWRRQPSLATADRE